MTNPTPPSRRRRILLSILITLLTCAALLYGLCTAIDRAIQSRNGPLHTFTLDHTPAFLTDDLALAKARETLTLDGLDPANWEPTTVGSDNTYVSRGTRSNWGMIRFIDKSLRERHRSRSVGIELKGDRIECQVVLPK